MTPSGIATLPNLWSINNASRKDELSSSFSKSSLSSSVIALPVLSFDSAFLLLSMDVSVVVIFGTRGADGGGVANDLDECTGIDDAEVRELGDCLRVASEAGDFC